MLALREPLVGGAWTGLIKLPWEVSNGASREEPPGPDNREPFQRLISPAATKFGAKTRAFDELTGKLPLQHNLPIPAIAPASSISCGWTTICGARGQGGRTDAGTGVLYCICPEC